ncbi:hypothetical protein V8F06_002098 [Rhypophila decipiens]
MMKPLKTLSQWAEAFTTPPTANGFFLSIFRIPGQLGIVELLQELPKKNNFEGDWPPTLESLGATSLTYTLEPAHRELEEIHDSSEHQAGMSESTDANSLTSWAEHASRPPPPPPHPLEAALAIDLLRLAGLREANLRFSQFLQLHDSGIMNGFMLDERPWPPAYYSRLVPRDTEIPPQRPHEGRLSYMIMSRALSRPHRRNSLRPTSPVPDNLPLIGPLRPEFFEGFELPIQPPALEPRVPVEIGARPGNAVVAHNSDIRPVTPPMQPPPNDMPVRDAPNQIEPLARNRLPPAEERPVGAGGGRNLRLRPAIRVFHHQGPPIRVNRHRAPQPRPPRPVRHGRETNQIRVPPPPAANLPTCLVCTEPVPGKRASSATLPCGHVFCENCLAAGIRSSLTNVPFVPVRCCQRIDMSVIRNSLKATSAEIQTYRKKLSEFDDGEPLYCHDPACSEFIPGALRSKNVGKCRRCHKKTCTLCRRAYHLRHCDNSAAANVTIPPDIIQTWVGRTAWREEMARRREAELRSQEREFRALSGSSGWKPCPKCHTMIDKIDGCNHIHCTSCGTHFCYRCGQAPYDSHGPCAM